MSKSGPLEPLTPSLVKAFKQEHPRGFVPYRWNRFALRLMSRNVWHAQSILIQFASRSHLRFLPFPYPSIGSVEQWLLQAQSMVNMNTLSRRHHHLALEAGSFTAENLIELGRLRDRCGWKTAFLEDGLLAGFIAARAQKGQREKLRAAALEETKARVAQESAEMDREIMARQLLGPRGGLPSLRSDLVKLALLLNLDPGPKETVPQLQARIRPLVELLKNKAPPSTSEQLRVERLDPLASKTPTSSTWSAVEAGEGTPGGRMPLLPRVAPHGASCSGGHEGSGQPLSGDVGTSSSSSQPGPTIGGDHRSLPTAFGDGTGRSRRDGCGPHQGLNLVQEDFKLHGKLKKGISQMISQAWHRHRRDQLALSVGSKEIQEVFMATWDMEMREALNETFAMELRLPSTFIAEVYTDTEPVAHAARRRGLNPGDSLTLGTGWDFRLAEHRKAALALIKKTKPYVVVLAFPCSAWSQLLALNAAVNLEKLRAEAHELVAFAIEVAQLQLKSGRHYLMENPRSSMAWKLEVMEDFVTSTGALKVVVDMCRFNLRAPGGELHKKATKLVTSMQALISIFLNKRCLGDHPHTPVIGGKQISAAAGHYTKEFSDAVIDGCMQQYDVERSLAFKHSETEFEAMSVEHEVMVVGDEEDLDSEASFEPSKDDEEKPIPAAIKNAVYRLHVNTSHRSNQRLARALLICGAPKEAVLAAKRLKCPVCAERRNPKPRPVASLPAPRDVGQQVHLDLVILEDSMRNPYVVAHATDNVSRYQAARILKDKSTASVIHFLTVHWLPLLGCPQTIVADQGREFVSAEFGDWCDSKSIYLYHIGVGAPWQNGICERSGATLKALVGAICQAHAIGNFEDMEMALGEAVSSYNSDLNEAGVAPIQLVTGRIPAPGGDVLNNFNARLSEHSLIEAKPTLSKLLAIRETSRLSMIRLHYSRGLRQAELARSRSSTVEDQPQPGDLVFFWRAQKYQSRKDVGAGTRRRLLLRRWHGPGLLVATEGRHGTELAANCFISFRGQLTKCPFEHVRKASSLESIAAGSWEAAIDEVISAAKDELRREEDANEYTPSDGPIEEAITSPRGNEPLAGGLQPYEIVAALQPPASVVPSMVGRSVPASLHDAGTEPTEAPGTAAPGTPVPSLILQASQAPSRLTSPMAGSPMSRTLERARAFDEQAAGQTADRGTKRPAEDPLPSADTVFSDVARPAFEALELTHAELENLAENKDIHPLLRLQAMVDADRRVGDLFAEPDHSSWDGKWGMLCERDWQLLHRLGAQLPSGAPPEHDVLALQTARKEYQWSKMSEHQKKLWGEAAVTGWKAYIDNSAVEVLSLHESSRIRKELSRRGELDRILVPRFVLTDKHDGLRTETNPLPVKASSRLVVPGFKDRTNLEGQLRRDAPTGSRNAQHILFSVAAFHGSWNIVSSDVKSAFLKGDPYINRELYICNSNAKNSPPLPLQPGQLCRVLKGIFGLADAPREWWLRLSRCLQDHGWQRTLVDGAMWCLWGEPDEAAKLKGIRPLEGLIVAHVDDLLFTGSPAAEISLNKVGSELGFGSQDVNDFTWCGKRIRHALDGTIRFSMVEYHQNLSEINLPKHRKSDPAAVLSAFEHRQLRAVLGSLQWLVAQLRFDLAFGVSSLQGENPPTIGSILRANQLVREFKRTGSFELVFRPIDYRSGGVVAVSDAALGNVQLSGSSEGTATQQVYSQACHFILLGDQPLVEGRPGCFNVLDARSHRIPRVCRSTYAAKTLSAEESLDAGQLARGFLATILGRDMLGTRADVSMNAVKMTGVVDAKDVYDKVNSDTASFGSQKSMAFTIAWLRSLLRRPNTALKWTATSNMFADAGTKQMSLEHLRKILAAGTWSISYSPEFQKQVYKAKSAKPSTNSTACAELPGVKLNGEDPMLPHLLSLCERRGWRHQAGMGIQVAFNAKSMRTSEPRFSQADFPCRTTFARFCQDGQSFWHRLEAGVTIAELSNQHALISAPAEVLVTFFHGVSTQPFCATFSKKKTESMSKVE